MNIHLLTSILLSLLFYTPVIAQNKISANGKHTPILQKKEENTIEIKPMVFNSTSADIFPRFLEDGLVFSSNRGKNETQKSNHDFYIIPDLSNPELKKLRGKMKSRTNETSIYASKQNKTIYFSRNKEDANIAKRERNGKIKLKSFTIEKTEKKWKKLKELPFNSDEYSVAHITLNASENKLYFVSDMAGGYGGMDIYEVDINQDGTYGTPKNLGPTINTTANETSPFLVDNNILYFASDNANSMGGFDIFKVNLSDREPLNLGVPLNSIADDYGLIANDKYVFFASDRDTETGDDNIYYITPNELKQLEQELTKSVEESIAKNSTTESIVIDTVKQQESEKIMLPDYKLDKAYSSLQRVILFGFDSAALRLEYEGALSNLTAFLKKHKEIKVILIGHTDNVGNEAYNLKLSSKRSKTVKAYLTNNGILKNRIITIGQGETNSTEDCTNCTKAQNQKNRRVEIKVGEK